jgi:hypothetical protein
MREGQARGVEELPLEPEIPRDPVGRVAGDGEVDRREVDPDLVGSARLEPDAEKRVLREELLELEVRHGLARRGGVERVAEPIVPVPADRRLDRPAPRPRPPRDEREVLPRQLPSPHEALQPVVRLLRARDDEQAGRVPVEPVDDAATLLLPALGSRSGQSLCERAAGVTGRGMDDDACRLVHDEEVLVRVDDREFRRRRDPLRRHRSRRLELDLLSAREPLTLAARLSVDEHGAGLEQPLGRGARAHLRQGGEETVEPLARGLRRDDEALQRFFGSRSARTSAASRIPTPITMKLSARLNAGQ